MNLANRVLLIPVGDLFSLINNSSSADKQFFTATLFVITIWQFISCMLFLWDHTKLSCLFPKSIIAYVDQSVLAECFDTRKFCGKFCHIRKITLQVIANF